METPFKFPVSDESRVRILQITDTHLFAQAEGTLLGVNTHDSYQAVLDAIKAQGGNFDIVVATGDLVQDQSFLAYQRFVDGVAQLPVPCVWLPGNHDFQPVMVDTMAKAGISSAKHLLLGRHWQLVLLDSQVAGVPYGELSEYQLEWLDKCLQGYQDRNTLVLLHHHPVPSGCMWLDQHSLRNAHALSEITKRYTGVRAVLCGHIHQELDLDWEGVRLLASPSTCVQFKPHCTNFTIDDTAPGWRHIDLLADGTIDTEIHRLNCTRFLPDMNSDGY